MFGRLGGYGYGYNIFSYIGGWPGLLVIILLLSLIYVMVKKPKQLVAYGKDDKALEIVKERFARGEITEEEYKKMVRIINDEY